MGPLISRFRRKQTTVELLEEIDKEINRLQRNRKVNQDRQKQFVTSLLIYSIAAYVIAAIIFFCICFPETWQLRLLYSTPLLIFPVLVWVVKRSLHWYFVQRISSNDTALEELRDRKNQILEDVMETETYKKAREILEKFDADRLHQLEGMPDNTPGYPSVSQDIPDNTPEYPRISQGIPEAVADNTPGPARPPRRPAGTMVQQRPRHRRMGLPPPGTFDLVRRASSQEQNGTPHLPSPLIPQQQAGYQAQAAVIGAEFAQPPRPPMARALLPRDRGVMDKLMDYLVGDGPENRYALICQQCFSHNGMALKEEFEYLSFRCCYCYWINPARKQRPTAPRLQFFAPPGMSPAHDSDTSASNEESDDKVKDDKIVSPEKPPPPGSSEGVSAAGELGEPAGQLKKLGEPAGQPGEPARQPQKLGEPAGQPGELGEPAGQSEKLGEPMGQPEEPSGQPREPAGQPGEPAGQPREPAGQPGELGEPAGQPGELGESAGQPGEPAGQPGEPAGQPGEPDVRSGCEGLDASLPAGATETSPDSELGESGWKRPAADCHAGETATV